MLPSFYAHISDRARALDRDTIAFSGLDQPVRDYEMTVELSYQAQIVPGWTVQPLFQYTVHRGHVPHPLELRPSKAERCLAVRSTIVY